MTTLVCLMAIVDDEDPCRAAAAIEALAGDLAFRMPCIRDFAVMANSSKLASIPTTSVYVAGQELKPLPAESDFDGDALPHSMATNF